ncbi:MAG: prepilin-type N-terminal cleavage/methylation domain-containing protein [Pirellulaceae bacterium]|nr:MAG: prepilin-type N-terminal cleavage/methylation domain-containing protein [Pirellulaceae bacterium]
MWYRLLRRRFSSIDGRYRPAFSLLELTVAVAILALLASLILMGVQWSREVARRLECQNHLAQQAQAIHAHVDAFKKLPDNGMDDRERKQPKFGRYLAHPTYFLHLIPFLGKEALYQREMYPGPPGVYIISYEQLQRELKKYRLSEARCPSDPGEGLINYRACAGTTYVIFSYEHLQNGAFPVYSYSIIVRPEDIRDGLSNTIGLSEKKVGRHFGVYNPDTDAWIGGIKLFDWDLWLPVTYAPIDDRMEELVKRCSAAPPRPPFFYDFPGGTWRSAYMNATAYNHIFPPNSRIPDCLPFSVVNIQALSASSYHPRGVNGLFLDGAVRFVSSDISLEVWRAWGTRSGSEMAGVLP